MSQSRTWVRWGLGFLLALAFLLRVYRLDHQSLWYDEILSASAADSSFEEMLRVTASYNHPPLYFIGLTAWQRLAGSSEFALRFPSVALGLVAVAALFPLARSVYVRPRRTASGCGRLGHGPAWITLVLASVAPLLVDYAQETRMYSPVLALTILSSLFLLCAMEPSGRRYWVGWTLLSLLAIYIDYSSLFVLIAQEVFFLVVLWRNPGPPKAGPWLVSSAALVLVFLPWLVLRQPLGQIYGDVVRGSSLGDIVQQTATGFSLGRAVELEVAWPLIALFWVLAVFGLVQLRHQRQKLLFLALYLGLPLVALSLLSIGRRDFAVRYALVAWPPFLLMVAGGLDWLRQRSRYALALGLGLTLIGGGWALFNYYTDPHFAREDFRSLARYLDHQLRDGDGVAFDAPWGQRALQYYHHGAIAAVPLEEHPQLDPGATEQALAGAASAYQRLWLVLWQDYFYDPGDFVRTWADKNLIQVEARAFSGITVYGYLTRSPVLKEVPPMQHATQIDLEGKMRLLGYDLDDRDLAAKGRLYVTLYWQALQAMDKSYYVYIHLINPAFRSWGQKDNRPGYDRFPTDTWTPGTILRDEYQIDLLPGTPPGVYRLEVGVYHPESGARLKVLPENTDRFFLGPVNISAIDIPPNIPHEVNAVLGSQFELVGYDLEGEVKRGGTLHLTLFWRALTPSNGRDYTVFTHLTDSAHHIVGQKDNPPADGTYPTSRWRPGEIVRDRYDITIPPDAHPGLYRLKVGMYDTATKQRLLVPGSWENAVLIRSFWLK